MKLNELHGYKQYADKDLQGIVDYLKSKGTVFAKTGIYSKVIIGNNYVYKIWVDDLAYEDWLRICHKHQGNPWVPKLIGSTKPMKLFFKHVEFNERISELKIQKMEKLETMPDIIKAKHFSNILDLMINFEMFSDQETFCANFADRLSKTSIPNKEELISNAPQLFEIFEELCSLIKIKGHGNDISIENYMMRGNQPVITDPLMMSGSHDLQRIDNLNIK